MDRMNTSRHTDQASLQNLPVEIRLRIYEHMTPPIDSRMADWRGMFMSCKQIHYEMKHELVRNMRRYLDQIKKQWTVSHDVRLHMSTPTKSSGINRISVAIPNSYFRALEAKFPAVRFFPTALKSLLQLGISQLTITRYEDDEKTKCTTPSVTVELLTYFMRDLMSLMDPESQRGRVIKFYDGAAHIPSLGSVIDRIAFEWGPVDGEWAEDLIIEYYAKEHPSDRVLELTQDHICGPATGATWIRRPYTWYGQVLGDFWSGTSDLKGRSRV
ncbi:hypothetical protein P171DRAFT_213342 [Karstenula rhodostoma CBS 690.94]|uniref:F-box domain-containing protein n=1 Tax=Karstenula rhodostoma CBS 690.94 TaxID=1392251 RepID=A0A9P4PT52_9PLEO|nr:hypothetical protein P171DRAFT_213342 [Karstenula rhodostoma CBS 690.94]